MTLRNIISYIVYRDFVSEKFIADRIFQSFRMAISRESFFPINPGAPVYINASKIQKQNRQLIYHNPI